MLKDFANATTDKFSSPTRASVTLGCLLFCAGAYNSELPTSNIAVALIHATVSQVKYARPPEERRRSGMLWYIRKAMNSMRESSADCNDVCSKRVDEHRIRPCRVRCPGGR